MSFMKLAPKIAGLALLAAALIPTTGWLTANTASANGAPAACAPTPCVPSMDGDAHETVVAMQGPGDVHGDGIPDRSINYNSSKSNTGNIAAIGCDAYSNHPCPDGAAKGQATE